MLETIFSGVLLTDGKQDYTHQTIVQFTESQSGKL